MTAAPLGHTFGSVEKIGPFDFGILRPSRRGALLALALGFLAFLPYPAIPAGRNSAVQAGNLLTLLMVLPSLALPWKRRPFLFYPLLLAPIAFSSLKVAIFGGDVGLCMKAMLVWSLSCLTMVATQLYAPRYGLHLMLGIAAAAVIHVAVGLWQLHTFAYGELPLVDLYVNPSFLTVQDRARIIARYIQRPFGLFPEPSAMSSSLAPWVLLWLAEVLGLVRFRQQQLARWHRALFAAAAAGGLLLIVLSRSGHALVTVAGAFILFLMWLKNSASSARTYAALLLVLGVLLPGLFWLTVNSLQDRVAEAGGNNSWDDRAASLAFGFKLLANGDVPSVVFGLGVGQSATALWDLYGLDAVWSVLLTYVYETGLIGAAVLGWIGWQLVSVWRETRLKTLFALLMITWLVGVTITTSYQQLLPLWVALGWLTVWPDVCEAPPRRTWARRPAPETRCQIASVTTARAGRAAAAVPAPGRSAPGGGL
jgi:hypothetical protein